MNYNIANMAWTQLQHDQCDRGRTGAQICELCYMRDRSDSTVLDEREIRIMIQDMCTECI